MEPEEIYVTCPYEKSHRIRTTKMPYHLAKCVRSHPEANKTKKTCPYDHTHVVNAVEFECHKKICPAREAEVHHQQNEVLAAPLEANNTGDGDVAANAAASAVDDWGIEVQSDGPILDDWGNPVAAPSNTPFGDVESRPIVRTMIGGSKAQKKKFRQQERLRHSQFNGN